jgi:CTP:phosphocholine cytidylyltransferase-like protein
MPQQDERSLAIIDLEHKMTEEWLLCSELEHRLLVMTGTLTSTILIGIGYFDRILTSTTLAKILTSETLAGI